MVTILPWYKNEGKNFLEKKGMFFFMKSLEKEEKIYYTRGSYADHVVPQ